MQSKLLFIVTELLNIVVNDLGAKNSVLTYSPTKRQLQRLSKEQLIYSTFREYILQLHSSRTYEQMFLRMNALPVCKTSMQNKFTNAKLMGQRDCHYNSSSFNNIFGIPFVMGNFRPVSGQTRSPSFTSTCNFKFRVAMRIWKGNRWWNHTHLDE